MAVGLAIMTGLVALSVAAVVGFIRLGAGGQSPFVLCTEHDGDKAQCEPRGVSVFDFLPTDSSSASMASGELEYAVEEVLE